MLAGFGWRSRTRDGRHGGLAFLPHIDRLSETWNRNSLMQARSTILILTRVVNICHSTATLLMLLRHGARPSRASEHAMNAKTDKPPTSRAPAQNVGTPLPGLRRL